MRVLVGLVAVAVVAATIATVPLFVRPASDRPVDLLAGEPVDAVLVLGGGQGERLARAGDLLDVLLAGADDGEPPPTLLLSVPFDAPLLRCGSDPQRPSVPVACLRPRPFTTSGEAVGLATTAAEQGWDRLVVVTSTTHLTRTRVLVQRCVEALVPDAEVAYVEAPEDLVSLRGPWSVATELASLLATPTDHQPPCG